MRQRRGCHCALLSASLKRSLDLVDTRRPSPAWRQRQAAAGESWRQSNGRPNGRQPNGKCCELIETNERVTKTDLENCWNICSGQRAFFGTEVVVFSQGVAVKKLIERKSFNMCLCEAWQISSPSDKMPSIVPMCAFWPFITPAARCPARPGPCVRKTTVEISYPSWPSGRAAEWQIRIKPDEAPHTFAMWASGRAKSNEDVSNSACEVAHCKNDRHEKAELAASHLSSCQRTVRTASGRCI